MVMFVGNYPRNIGSFLSALCFLSVFLFEASPVFSWDQPIRVIAGADVLNLGMGRYSVREYLDVHNDDFVKTLKIKEVTANTWIGHRRDQTGENWIDVERPLFIPPGEIMRVCERQRIVAGKPKRNWWVRWIRFTVGTDRGDFTSNFISSPLKPPGIVEAIKTLPQVDSLAAP